MSELFSEGYEAIHEQYKTDWNTKDLHIPRWTEVLSYDEAYEKYAKYPGDHLISNCVSFIELDDFGNQDIENYEVKIRNCYKFAYFRYRTYWYCVGHCSLLGLLTQTIIDGEVKELDKYTEKQLRDDPMLPITDMIREYGQHPITKSATRIVCSPKQTGS